MIPTTAASTAPPAVVALAVTIPLTTAKTIRPRTSSRIAAPRMIWLSRVWVTCEILQNTRRDADAGG